MFFPSVSVKNCLVQVISPLDSEENDIKWKGGVYKLTPGIQFFYMKDQNNQFQIACMLQVISPLDSEKNDIKWKGGVHKLLTLTCVWLFWPPTPVDKSEGFFLLL